MGLTPCPSEPKLWNVTTGPQGNSINRLEKLTVPIRRWNVVFIKPGPYFFILFFFFITLLAILPTYATYNTNTYTTCITYNTPTYSTNNTNTYYISKLVSGLWLVNLAGRTLMHEPLKFKVFLVPNCCVIYHQIFSTYEANNSSKLYDLKTISNWLVLLSAWFRNLKPFLMNGNCSQTRQTHNRDK